MIEKKMWGLTVVAVGAFVLSACGGDGGANGETAAAEAAETAPAQMAAVGAEGGEEMVETEATPQELPEGVTAEMIEAGRELYNGAGICMSCHGPDGAGIPNLGANLTDDEWLHSDGTYEAIVESIMDGVTAQASSSGVPMPAKGGTAITDDQVRAVAAYVWSLSQ